MPPLPTNVKLYQHLDQHVRHGRATLIQQVGGRQRQEDAALLGNHLWAVADGMGGHPSGDQAARDALATLAGQLPAPASAQQLSAATAAADQAVRALATGTVRNPGTTLVAAGLDPDQARIHGVWCGDSRAYLLRPDASLIALTADHANLFGGLEHSLGDHFSEPHYHETFSCELAAGHQLLLTTDGLTGPYGDQHELLETHLAAHVTDAVDYAQTHGTDNITALLIDLGTWADSGAVGSHPSG